MAQLIVRNLDADLVRKLKIRAAEHGRSTEEEHRQILRGALGGSSDVDFKQLLLSMPDVGVDHDFVRVDDRGRDLGW